MPPRMSVAPERALIDVDREIRIDGFGPYACIDVTAEMRMCGVPWRARATFLAGADGSLDLDRDSPVSGDYAEPGAMGLVWSMQCQDLPHAVFPPDRTDALTVHITASDGRHEARATLVQEFLAEGVRHQAVRAQAGGMSLSGELYTPPGPGPHPAVIYMNGSSGGVNAPRAALFAARGYQCLALGIFNYEGRPQYLNDMPLEYLEQALRWVRDTQNPRNGFVAISGISRGGEMSLLAASHFPELVSAVVAYVPSPVMHGVVSAGAPGTGRDAQVWTLGGKPLPHLWQDNATADWEAAYASDPPYRQTHAFMSASRDARAFERARIPIERYRGPLMLISASDDGFWPSTAYSEIVVRQRQAAWPARPAEHYVCRGAGHHVHYPNLPATLISKPHAMSGLLLDAGGTPPANAHGNAGSYRAMLDFLERAQAA
ncbi:acyl-CoA thioesterase/BAAT N-terminal domain-containing protein [Bordetella bronchiseptica]|uniref:acyl-CoA thioesterase/BAAT N-terminal domain-containing protein n=1 Tax=Bordetella bronchiseptica TaxID=518 RepID=UPI00028A47D6|nr:acyl-CoA thioester hydrolase/BAAT C-terminal domain-containing protein [Bordetella bronchiseptica]AUL16008.1 acyl-CoA thioester hydrolase [Bordetella bronchiseptica]AWP59164.1 acyl-CoA thioester hydrolase [Bordetella bronchiseptica]KAK53286.1 acyl-CoA thioester hydrolase/BAAT N-terminal domain protein [Bordetella bronchiseptica OSU054]KAK65769.1 acyl-CoA thioester hydrolase/BAAT N-terminal domain protein [Bordetella bronchiseptica MO211]KAK72911.1 acyl-CoA thioester hydrolase/BAAT N-termina